MSSAAVHAVPPPAQPYHVAMQQSPDASPVSSRNARSHTGNGSTPQSPLQSHQQQQHQQQQQSSPAMTSPTTSNRVHASPASHVSPTSSRNVSSSVPYDPYHTDRSEAQASSSPYTSAQQRSHDERPPSSRVPNSQYASGYGSGSERESTSGQRPTADGGLPREDSTIINRLVVADPEENIERAQARVAESQGAMPDIGALSVDDSARAGPRSRQEHLKSSQPRKETKFGEYILGQTVGEGEFGKVKMGWKKDGGVQVAIKLIRKESLGNNPNRLPKIYREIAILRELKHPNIVRLHEMVETERHIGIILEYASGGELFDYILNHRYLNDKAARRLFAQLVSGVGYLHKKGIVHRDLKLENLLLDRNKNIIITDFGFANTFNPSDELGEQAEHGLQDKEFVKRMGLDQILKDGHRRGDLMQTSCGSPCYAAPELVVSDSLYTGRKVDVWSCGVILYAMLAGYLPFDDDPANPEGDNINLLYKYIVTTPLTFPEYVTPHARDLLRRILVPDPRKRADLFEVARHSWLSEYAKVVEHVTSGATTVEDIANSTVPSEDPYAVPQLGRSASVREPSRTQQPTSSAGLSGRHATPIEEREEREKHKRATLQVEYVKPNTSTTRGDPAPTTAHTVPEEVPSTPITPVAATQPKTRARGDSMPTEVPPSPYQSSAAASSTQRRPATQNTMAPPARPVREPPRSVSESTALNMNPPNNGRPSTSGTMDRVGDRSRLPSRGNSYGQAIAPTVAATNAEGRFSQPKNSGYIISGSVPEGSSKRNSYNGRPLSQQLQADFNSRPESRPERPPQRGHKRSSTVESITSKIFGRTNSRRQSNGREDAVRPEKSSRAYPPLSMKNAMPIEPDTPSRPSTDSRRPSFSLGRKNSDYNGQQQQQRSSRRFSFLPSSFSRMSFNSTPKAEGYDSAISSSRRASLAPQPTTSNRTGSRLDQSGMAFGRGRSPSESTTGSNIPVLYDSSIENRDKQHAQRRMPQQGPVRGATAPDLMNIHDPATSQQQYSRQQSRQQGSAYTQSPPTTGGQQERQDTFYTPSQSLESQDTSEMSGQAQQQQQQQQQQQRYPAGFNENEQVASRPAARQQAVLQKNRKFGDAYESGSGSSSGGAKRVMDWFRRRGKDRSG